MGRLTGRQWGLVAVVAGTPFVFAFWLAAAAPALLERVLGTALGGASWVFAALLGLLGGALFAGCLSQLAAPTASLGSRLRYTAGMATGALVSVGLCIVPAFCLLLAGPALSARLERGEVMRPVAEQLNLGSPEALAEQLMQRLPHQLPRLPQLPRVNNG
jgi:hypothetical protein